MGARANRPRAPACTHHDPSYFRGVCIQMGSSSRPSTSLHLQSYLLKRYDWTRPWHPPTAVPSSTKQSLYSWRPPSAGRAWPTLVLPVRCPRPSSAVVTNAFCSSTRSLDASMAWRQSGEKGEHNIKDPQVSHHELKTKEPGHELKKP